MAKAAPKARPAAQAEDGGSPLGGGPPPELPPEPAPARPRGFYWRAFRAQENQDLEALAPQQLDSEVALLRVFQRRLLEITSQESPDIEALCKALAVLGATSSRIAGLLRAQKLLQDEGGPWPGGGGPGAALNQALAETLKEMQTAINDPRPPDGAPQRP